MLNKNSAFSDIFFKLKDQQMNKTILYLYIMIFVILFPITLFAQKDTTNISKTEISLRYSLQCPLYSVNTAQDLTLSQDTRYRSRFSIGIRYYVSKRWYTEFSPAFSQEGGGYKKQKTNAN
jgi:hypothetical protein